MSIRKYRWGLYFSEINSFTEYLDFLLNNSQKFNRDSLHGMYWGNRKALFPNLEKLFGQFVKTSCGDVKDIELILKLQSRYRYLFGWDEIVFMMGDSAGYLAQKYNSITEYLFNRIIKHKKDPTNVDEVHFYTYALTIAAQINPVATDYYRKLWFTCSSGSEGKEQDSEAFLGKLSNQTFVGLRDHRKKFSIASVEVIEFLINLIKKLDYMPLGICEILETVLGETPNVRCIKIGNQKKYSYSNKNFSTQILNLLEINPPFEPNNSYYDILIKWTMNDQDFKQKVLNILCKNKIDQSLLIRYFKIKIMYKSWKFPKTNFKDLLNNFLNLDDKNKEEYIKSIRLDSYENTDSLAYDILDYINMEKQRIYNKINYPTFDSNYY